MSILTNYWGIIVAFVVGVVYVVTHRQWAISYAKGKIPQLMLIAEKRAEELLLKRGVDKKEWCVSAGYDLLPAAVRLVVSKPLFTMFVQEIFDNAIAFAKAHTVTQAPVSPDVEIQPVADQTPAQ